METTKGTLPDRSQTCRAIRPNTSRGDILALEILRDLGYTIKDDDEPDNPSDIGEYIKAVYGQ